MPDAAEETIKNWSAALPAKLRDAVLTVPMAELIYDIGRQHDLSIDKIGELAEEIVRFISGEIRSKEFISRLLQILGADREKTAAVATDVNNKIFASIRDALKKATMPPPAQKVAPPAAAPAAPTKPAAPPPKPAPQTVGAEPRKPEPIIIAPIAAKPKEEKPLPPIPKPIEPKPAQILRGKTLAGEPVKPPPTGPQPLIIYPLPKKEGIKESWGAKPPAATYERAQEAVKKELETFRKDEAAKETEIPPRPTAPPPPKATAGTAPSPYVITREELQKEIEKFRKNDQVDEGDESGEIAPEPTPPKLPQQKIPKPQAPESYAVDPYKEPVE